MHLLQEHRNELAKGDLSQCQGEESPSITSNSASTQTAVSHGLNRRTCHGRRHSTSSTSHPDVSVALKTAQGSEVGAAYHNLLDVPMLTREALEGCIEAFLSIIGPAYRLSQDREILLQRVQVLLYHIAGLEAPLPLVEQDAASELLTVSIASIGAPFSSTPQFARPLHDRCCVLLEDPSNLISHPLDAIEAVSLLERRRIPSQPFTGFDRRPRDDSASNPLKLDPLSSGFAVELARYHGLLTTSSSPDQQDFDRRKELFWILWETDAVRRVCMGAPCCLTNAEIGWARPSIPSSDAFRWDLADVGRQISATLLSPRAVCQGNSEGALLSTVEALDDMCCPMHAEISRADAAAAAEMTYLLSTHRLFYLVCWKAGRQQVENIAEETFATLEAAVLRASGRMEDLASLVVEKGLLPQTTKDIRDHMVAFVLYILQTLPESSVTSEDDRSSRLRRAERLIEAVRSATAQPDTPRLADALRQVVWRVKTGTSTRGISGALTGPTHASPASNSAAERSQSITADSHFSSPGSSCSKAVATQQQSPEGIDQELLHFVAAFGSDLPRTDAQP